MFVYIDWLWIAGGVFVVVALFCIISYSFIMSRKIEACKQAIRSLEAERDVSTLEEKDRVAYDFLIDMLYNTVKDKQDWLLFSDFLLKILPDVMYSEEKKLMIMIDLRNKGFRLCVNGYRIGIKLKKLSRLLNNPESVIMLFDV